MGDRTVEFGPYIYCKRESTYLEEGNKYISKEPKSGWDIDSLFNQNKVPHIDETLYWPAGEFGDNDMWLLRDDDVTAFRNGWSRSEFEQKLFNNGYFDLSNLKIDAPKIIREVKKKYKVLIELLEKIYGKENVFVKVGFTFLES